MSKHAKFNREDVIEKATNLYWEKGFHGTSMRNLQNVIDMRPGSIYACFGSKENLFREAIVHYKTTFSTQLNLALADELPIIEALRLFIKKATIDDQRSAPSGMCMLVKTMGELTDEHADLLAKTRQLLAEIETEFSEVMKKAIAQGEIDKTQDPVQLARYLQVQIMGIRTYARINNDDDVTEALIDHMFDNGPFR